MVAKLLSTKLLRAAWREGLSQKVAVYVDAPPPHHAEIPNFSQLEGQGAL